MQTSISGNTQQTSKSTSRTKFMMVLLPIIVIVLVGANLYWLQWASNQGITMGYPQPQVHMNALPSTIRSQQTIDFSAHSSGRNLTYSWVFTPTNSDTTTSDSSSSTDNTNATTTNTQGQHVTHEFAASGTYTIMVSVYDPLGHFSNDTQTVNVLPVPPQANFTASTDSSFFDMSVTCDATQSVADPGTTIQSYTWDFGDGSQPETTNYEADTHYYDKAGTYTVTLVVTDATGQQSKPATQTVVIAAPSNN